MAQQPFEQCFFEKLVSMYTCMYTCTFVFINSVFLSHSEKLRNSGSDTLTEWRRQITWSWSGRCVTWRCWNLM
jgi:hypothetical protein